MKRIPQLSISPFAPIEPVDGANLSKADREFLEMEEAIISAGRRSFIDVGSALLRVRDYRNGMLYKESYGSFEAYCEERWGFGQSYAYRIIGAAQIVSALSPRGEKEGVTLPSNEKQIRALSLLESPKDRIKAWGEAVRQAGEDEVPATLVSRVVRDLVQKGAKRRRKEGVRRRTPKTLNIDAEAISAIRRHLAVIGKAGRGMSKIVNAVAEIECLLPG